MNTRTQRNEQMMVQPQMDNLHLFNKGRVAATSDMDIKSFDVGAAIASFKDDPADSPFQRGYLRELLKSGEATQ